MLASFLLSLLAVSPAQEPDPVETRLDRVTVYSGQAMVERVFQVSATAPGPQSVWVGPLPMTVDRESFQTRVAGDTVVLQGLEVRQRTGELDQSARDGLRQEIANLRAQLRALDAKAESIHSGEGVVQAVINSVGKEGLAGYSGMTLDNVFEFVTKRSEELDQRAQAHERERDELTAKINDLEKQLGGRANSVRPYQEVKLDLFFQRAGTTEVRLLYLSYGARWEPVYDLHLKTDLTAVDVGLVGRIYQETDEDWNNVEVLLSTAQPQLGLDPPAIPERYARVFNRESKRVLRELGYVSDSAAPSARPMESLELVEEKQAFAAAPMASVQDYGLSQQFALPDRVTVASGTEPRQFRLVGVPLEVRPERYLIPSVSQLAYLRADVVSEAEAPLLPGMARVFLGPDYLGEVAFPLMRQGDSTTLNLGIDPNLKVEYRKIYDKRDEPGLFSDTLRHGHQWMATLSLSAAAPEDITVFLEEVIPVSTDNRIKIEPLRMHAGALESEQDLLDRKERGIWRWRFPLKPGQERIVRWGYTAIYDEDLNPVIDQ